MKKHILIGVAALTAFLAAALLLQIPVSADLSRSFPASASPAPEISPPIPADYLLVFPVVPPNPVEVPAGLTAEQAAGYAHSLTYRQADPILPELERLRAEGLVAGFEVRPDLHGVVMRGVAPGALEALSRVQGFVALMPHSETSLSTCAVAAARALPERIMALSRMAGERAARFRVVRMIQATDPSIDVWVQPGSTGEGYSDVSGQTTPNVLVTMRILRGGRVITTQSTTSSSDGWYIFDPTWQDCPVSGYNWSLRPGDVVEVTAHGNTVSTVVADLWAWVDPVTNLVAGRTNPDRSVEVRLSYPSSGDPCSWDSRSKIVVTDPNGNFNVDFSDQVDFNRTAAALVYARDANGNSTWYVFHGYRVAAGFYRSAFAGYLKPEVDFTATLSRSGGILSTYSGKSGPDNYYSGSFTDTIRPGDVISVSGGGVNIQYIATDLNIAFDVVANQANGTTGANRLVQVYFQKRDAGYVRTSCSGGFGCASSRASGSGDFSIDADLDLARGDYGYFYVYDDEGNFQTAEIPVPAIVADLSYHYVRGYWGRPGASLTVRVKRGDGTILDTRTGVSTNASDGSFSASVAWDTIAPAHIVEVTDSVFTETMTVQSLTARLDGGTGHLTGNATSGHLLAQLRDSRREGGEYLYCSEATVSSPYDLTFSGAQVGGGDYAQVWLAGGSDGHYTYYPRAYAFTVGVMKEGQGVSGYTETPQTPYTVTLGRGGTMLAAITGTSWWVGDFSASMPITIAQGDVVTVQTGDGDNVSLTVPELTLNTDATNNRIYGKSPASQPVTVGVSRVYNWGSYTYRQTTTADGSGNYSASFANLYWTRDCSVVNLGHRCIRPYVTYRYPSGHSVGLSAPYPPPVAPDLYESDDVSTTARAYTGVQSHTFHTYTDTDWVTFTVPVGDVGNVQYRIRTFNMGWGLYMQTALYDPNMNLLGGGWGFPDPSYETRFTPTLPGTYFLKIAPWLAYPGYGGYCDAVYDLMILPVRAQVYLPLVVRNY